MIENDFIDATLLLCYDKHSHEIQANEQKRLSRGRRMQAEYWRTMVLCAHNSFTVLSALLGPSFSDVTRTTPKSFEIRTLLSVTMLGTVQ